MTQSQMPHTLQTWYCNNIYILITLIFIFFRTQFSRTRYVPTKTRGPECQVGIRMMSWNGTGIRNNEMGSSPHLPQRLLILTRTARDSFYASLRGCCQSPWTLGRHDFVARMPNFHLLWVFECYTTLTLWYAIDRYEYDTDWEYKVMT